MRRPSLRSAAAVGDSAGTVPPSRPRPPACTDAGGAVALRRVPPAQSARTAHAGAACLVADIASRVHRTRSVVHLRTLTPARSRSYLPVMTPTLAQLRYLVAVADCRSITSAAASVFVAQSALSRAVQAMERDLGVDLLARRGRGVELTPEGARVVRLARTVLDAVEAIDDIGTAHGNTARTTLNLVTTPTLALDLASDLVPAYSARHPGVDVHLQQYDGREALVQSVTDGRAELALVDLPVDKELSTHYIQEREVVLISPLGCGLPDPMPLRALDGLPMVLPTPGTGRRTEMEAMFSCLGVRPVPSLEVDERLAWVTGVTDGRGSLIWYRDVVLRAFGDRAEIRSFTPPLLRPVGIAHARRPLSRAARAFIAHARHNAPVREPAR
ncbi:LysR family transcriptional regulator [Streptomyces venezuelae]|uniref:LysR family transcriptional regulator n=2 Tax=Streptomyces venezuelae TaxID=54571 RepID=A0A5P2CZK0_STRVZ|nr:LysR family transcriptional regulator [Streptomyces venezuelae]